MKAKQSFTPLKVYSSYEPFPPPISIRSDTLLPGEIATSPGRHSRSGPRAAVDKCLLRTAHSLMKNGNGLKEVSAPVFYSCSDLSRLRTETGLGGLIGASPEMEKVYRIVSKVAHTVHPVLILGESGTGKEMVARSIHMNGPNAAKPFIPVDCGSLVPTLIESELFGHVKGAFTGANRSKEGLLSAAAGGTVFLDEIGDLPMDLQARLLRALQEKEVRPVGATRGPDLRSGAGGDQTRPGRDGGSGDLPQGPLLSPQRGQPEAAAAA